MNDKEMIQALKSNERPFGLMTTEMQDKMNEIDAPGVFVIFWTAGEWVERTVVGFGKKLTYRLRPGYEPPEAKPEIVEYPISIGNDNILGFLYEGNSFNTRLNCAIEHPDFLGFLYKDPRMACESKRSALPRLYLNKDGDTYCHAGSNGYGEMVVLTPIAVLFKEGK